MSAGAQPLRSRPATSASPIFPPPRTASGAVMAPRLREEAHRVLGCSVDPRLEVQVRPGGVAGRTHVADDLALRYRLAVDGAEAALVGVRGREAAAVVDHDDVAVTVHPARVDHGPALGGADRRAGPGRDVDALVHAAPAHA